MINRAYRTTCFADAIIAYDNSLYDDPRYREEVIGFRLARPDGWGVFQSITGSPTYSRQHDIRRDPRQDNRFHAAHPKLQLGFRIVYDRQEDNE